MTRILGPQTTNGPRARVRLPQVAAASERVDEAWPDRPAREVDRNGRQAGLATVNSPLLAQALSARLALPVTERRLRGASDELSQAMDWLQHSLERRGDLAVAAHGNEVHAVEGARVPDSRHHLARHLGARLRITLEAGHDLGGN